MKDFNNVKLLPCPFCGAAAQMRYVNLINCTDTVSCGAEIHMGDSGERTAEYAIASWNSRTKGENYGENKTNSK